MSVRNSGMIYSKKRSRLVMFLLVFSVSVLAFGFTIGASKLSAQHGFHSNTDLSTLIVIHPVLMVFGVIGGLLMAEKLELMLNFKIYKRLNMAFLIVPFTVGGITLYSLGLSLPLHYMAYAGASLMALTGLLFMWFIVSRRTPGKSDAKVIMGSALLALALSALSEAGGKATESPDIALLLLTFPIIYVLGERIELGEMKGIKRIWISFLKVSSIAVPVLLFLGTMISIEWAESLFFNASVLLLALMALLSGFNDPSMRGSSTRNVLQSFMKFGIRSSYAWLFLGLALYLIQYNISRGFMDVATHSIALGFIGAFIISHSPIIFPLILKIKADTERVTKLPLYTLDVAVALRVGGDIMARLIGVGNVLVYSSIWILLLAILLFAVNIAKISAATQNKRIVAGSE